MQFAGVQLQKNVPCLLSDGIKLYADIYSPAGSGELPVLLMRQPYGKMLASTVTSAHPVWYASQGFMVVIQDVRGRGESEGEFYPYLFEARDGYEAVEWAARLPRSNGKVGMYGFSYQGAAQWAAASMQPPHLAAIAPAMCAPDLYYGNFYPYGSFQLLELRTWAYQLARDTARRAGDAEAEAYCTDRMANSGAWLNKLPLRDNDEVLEQYFPAYYDWVSHPEYDAYWKQFNWLHAAEEIIAPALHIGGWYDYILDGTIQGFEAMSRTRGKGLTAGYDQLLIGPWSHIPWGRFAGGVDHGPSCGGDVHRQQLRWFNYWLKGEPTSFAGDAAPVCYYEYGSGKWRPAQLIPGAEQLDGSKKFYLSNSGRPANGSTGGGKLTEQSKPSTDSIPDVFVYDARLPMKVQSYLPADRSEIQERYEILAYTSEPLEEELAWAGSPILTIRYETLAGPTDLVAILSVVTPDGAARMLSLGRAEIQSEADAHAGQKWIVRVVMRVSAAVLNPGDRLRIELTGSAFPLWNRHMNGIRLAEQTRLGEDHLNMATTAVYANGSESLLELPLAAVNQDLTLKE